MFHHSNSTLTKTMCLYRFLCVFYFVIVFKCAFPDRVTVQFWLSRVRLVLNSEAQPACVSGLGLKYHSLVCSSYMYCSTDEECLSAVLLFELPWEISLRDIAPSLILQLYEKQSYCVRHSYEQVIVFIWKLGKTWLCAELTYNGQSWLSAWL